MESKSSSEDLAVLTLVYRFARVNEALFLFVLLQDE